MSRDKPFDEEAFDLDAFLLLEKKYMEETGLWPPGKDVPPVCGELRVMEYQGAAFKYWRLNQRVKQKIEDLLKGRHTEDCNPLNVLRDVLDVVEGGAG